MTGTFFRKMSIFFKTNDNGTSHACPPKIYIHCGKFSFSHSVGEEVVIMSGYGGGSSFVLIVVLFILLIIVGASFMGGY